MLGNCFLLILQAYTYDYTSEYNTGYYLLKARSKTPHIFGVEFKRRIEILDAQ